MKDALQGGPLAQLLERNREHTLSMRGSECVLKGVKSPGIIS
jgi:hypothetical protein